VGKQDQKGTQAHLLNCVYSFGFEGIELGFKRRRGEAFCTRYTKKKS